MALGFLPYRTRSSRTHFAGCVGLGTQGRPLRSNGTAKWSQRAHADRGSGAGDRAHSLVVSRRAREERQSLASLHPSPRLALLSKMRWLRVLLVLLVPYAAGFAQARRPRNRAQAPANRP